MEPKGLPRRLADLLPSGGLGALTHDIEFISLWRWAKLSLAIGIVVGLAAAGVFYVLELGEEMLLYRLGGYDGSVTERGWLLLALPAAGGLIAGTLIFKLCPEAAGAGVNPVVDSFHNGNARIRTRVPLVKLVATVFTLGTGGSAGREGPMAQIGAGFGAFLGLYLGLNARERRLLLLAGAAGGISALFRSPLGAALWSLEVIYGSDFESEGLLPCLVSSVTAYSVFTTIFGQGSLFAVDAAFVFHPAQLVFYAALAIACAPLGVIWIKLLHGSRERLWARLPMPPWLKPAIGGLLLGGLCIAVPWVFGSGYEWMREALRPVDSDARVLATGYEGFGLLLGIACAKMLATSLTVSSGGSGGVFAPSLFIGGFIGGAFGLLFHELAPSVVGQPEAFVLVGMGAFYAGVGRVPLATIILISEMFGSYDLLVPLMFSEMITVSLLRRFTLYEKQVPSAVESPAHLSDFTVDVLQDLEVRQHYTPGRASETVPNSMTIRRFLEHVSQTADSFFVVHNKDRELVGIVSLSNVRSVVTEQPEFLDVIVVNDAMWPFQSLSPDANLRAALRQFLYSGYDHLPVVDPSKPKRVAGMLSQHQVFSAYNAEIVRRQLDDPLASESMSMPKQSE